MIFSHIFLVILVTVILIVFAEYQKLRNVSWMLFIGCTTYILLNIETEKTYPTKAKNSIAAAVDTVSVTSDTKLPTNTDTVLSKVVIDKLNNNILIADETSSINDNNNIHIQLLAMATNILNKEPTGVSRLFLNDISELFCFTVVENKNTDSKIIHNWKRYQEDYLYVQDFFKSTINIGTSPNWRCWSKITIKPEMAGDWQVIVTDSMGNKLDSIDFSIIPTIE
jgi:hypothetical protein